MYTGTNWVWDIYRKTTTRHAWCKKRNEKISWDFSVRFDFLCINYPESTSHQSTVGHKKVHIGRKCPSLGLRSNTCFLTQTEWECRPWEGAAPSLLRFSSTEMAWWWRQGLRGRHRDDNCPQARKCGPLQRHSRTRQFRFGSGHGPTSVGASGAGRCWLPREVAAVVPGLQGAAPGGWVVVAPAVRGGDVPWTEAYSASLGWRSHCWQCTRFEAAELTFLQWQGAEDWAGALLGSALSLHALQYDLGMRGALCKPLDWCFPFGEQEVAVWPDSVKGVAASEDVGAAIC